MVAGFKPTSVTWPCAWGPAQGMGQEGGTTPTSCVPLKPAVGVRTSPPWHTRVSRLLLHPAGGGCARATRTSPKEPGKPSQLCPPSAGPRCSHRALLSLGRRCQAGARCQQVALLVWHRASRSWDPATLPPPARASHTMSWVQREHRLAMAPRSQCDLSR